MNAHQEMEGVIKCALIRLAVTSVPVEMDTTWELTDTHVKVSHCYFHILCKAGGRGN